MLSVYKKNYLNRNLVFITFLIFSTVVYVFQISKQNKGEVGGCSHLFRICIYLILYELSF